MTGIFLYCYQDCLSCPTNSTHMSRAIWAAVKKYSHRYLFILTKNFYNKGLGWTGLLWVALWCIITICTFVHIIIFFTINNNLHTYNITYNLTTHDLIINNSSLHTDCNYSYVPQEEHTLTSTVYTQTKK